MSWSRIARLAPATGVLAFALIAVGFFVTQKDQPDFVGTSQAWATYFLGSNDRILTGALVEMTGVFFLLWFLGSVGSVLGLAEGGQRRLTAVARAGGVAGGALLLAGNGALAMGAWRVDDVKTISSDMAGVYGDLWAGLGFVAAAYGFAALLGAFAVVTLRNGAFPAWLGWVSAIIAIGLLIPIIAYIFLGLFLIWVLVVAVILLVRGVEDDPDAVQTLTPAVPATE